MLAPGLVSVVLGFLLLESLNFVFEFLEPFALLRPLLLAVLYQPGDKPPRHPAERSTDREEDRPKAPSPRAGRASSQLHTEERVGGKPRDPGGCHPCEVGVIKELHATRIGTPRPGLLRDVEQQGGGPGRWVAYGVGPVVVKSPYELMADAGCLNEVFPPLGADGGFHQADDWHAFVAGGDGSFEERPEHVDGGVGRVEVNRLAWLHQVGPVVEGEGVTPGWVGVVEAEPVVGDDGVDLACRGIQAEVPLGP